MAEVTIELPSLLGSVGEGVRSLPLQAETLRAAMETLRERHPRIAVHLFAETQALRPHVRCFLNETDSRWLPSPDQPLRDGDRILFMQAITGG